MIVGAHGPVMIDGSATVCGPQPAGIKNDTVTLEKTAPGQSRQGVSANVTSGALAFPLLVLEELGLALVFLGCRACLGCLLLVVSLVLLRLALFAEVIATGDAPERLFSTCPWCRSLLRRRQLRSADTWP